MNPQRLLVHEANQETSAPDMDISWKWGLPSSNQTWLAGKWTLEISEIVPTFETSIETWDFPAMWLITPEGKSHQIP